MKCWKRAVDANAIRILGQEIYESESSLRQAKQHLAQVMADKLRLQRQLDAQQTQLVAKEALIRRHLEQGDEAAALSLAEDFSQHEAPAWNSNNANTSSYTLTNNVCCKP